ncbi:uncharacterized protein V1518DRAFT_405794 [Limtongia smithiae]|uniref:uncharacterized protein n=1 Tax=Limtongia smithiae TaxID=1125753 RepID=UPI0034CD557D
MLYTTAISTVTLLSAIIASVLLALLDLLVAACAASFPGAYTRIKALSHSNEHLRIGISEYNLWRFRRRQAASTATATDDEEAAEIATSSDYRRQSTTTVASDLTRTETFHRTANFVLPGFIGEKEFTPVPIGDHDDDVNNAVVLEVPRSYSNGQRTEKFVSTTVVLLLGFALAYAVIILSWGLGYAAHVTEHLITGKMSLDTLESAPINLDRMFDSSSVMGLDYNCTDSTIGPWVTAESSLFLFGANGTYSESEDDVLTCGYIEALYYDTYLSGNAQRSVARARGNFTTYLLVCYEDYSNVTQLYRVSSVVGALTNHIDNSVLSLDDQQSSLLFVNIHGTATPKLMTSVSRTETYISSSDHANDILEDLLLSDPQEGWTTDFVYMVVVATKTANGTATMKVVTSYEEYTAFISDGDYQYADFVLTTQTTSETGEKNRTLYWYLSNSDNELYAASTIYSMYDLNLPVAWMGGMYKSVVVDDTSATATAKGNITVSFSTVYTGGQFDVQMPVWRYFNDHVGEEGWSITQTLTRTVFDITLLVYILAASVGAYVVLFVLCWIFRFKFSQRAIIYHLYSELAKPPGAEAESILSINKDLNGSVHETEIEMPHAHGPMKRKTYKCGVTE